MDEVIWKGHHYLVPASEKENAGRGGLLLRLCMSYSFIHHIPTPDDVSEIWVIGPYKDREKVVN